MPTSKRIRSLSFFVFLLSLPILACGFFASSSSPETAASPSQAPVASSPTVNPDLRSLTVCLGQEPNTLYPFGEPNAAARSVLAAVNDGPYDVIGYAYQPVILTQTPSLKNGDAQIVKIQVQAGGQVVDADGNLVALEKGVKIRPAGCRDDNCVIAYDGATALEMDQMVVNFRLRSDLTWSDGTPLTADDSVYAFTIASDPKAVVNTYLVDRTQTYEATDAQTVQWWGKPGFIDPAYPAIFFTPAPKNSWSRFPIDQLPKIDIASRTPMGWGAYALQEWIANDHIKLTKNPYYFRAADGYPKFDVLNFRFIKDPNIALSEMIAGRCDILDPSIRLDNHVGLLQEMQKAEQAQAFFTPGMTVEWLGLGITPASYEDGYNINFQNDRQDIFGDAHTRQGIVYCLDRQSVVNNVLFGLTTVPTAYVPVDHPVYDPNIDPTPYDPTAGGALLKQAGWVDTDGNPATPLLAVTVKNVKAGTPLLVNYYTTTATQRRQVVDILSKSLAQCGIALNVKYFAQNDLYAPGPEGLLFGRKFDLIEYAMGVDGVTPPCGWFTSAEIPTAANSWIGTNLTGYKNKDYDAACRATQFVLPDEQAYADAYSKTQVIFSTEFPAIPLYYRLRIAAARPDLCHFDLDPTANPLWNIEAIDIGEACKK